VRLTLTLSCTNCLDTRYSIFRTALELLEAIGARDVSSDNGGEASDDDTTSATAAVDDRLSMEAADQASVGAEVAALRSEVADLRSQVADVVAENHALKRTLLEILQRLDGDAAAHSSLAQYSSPSTAMMTIKESGVDARGENQTLTLANLTETEV
jgi:hypothetical protein